MLRYDTVGTRGAFSLRFSDLGHNGGLNAALPGSRFLVNTEHGPVSAAANRRPIPDGITWRVYTTATPSSSTSTASSPARGPRAAASSAGGATDHRAIGWGWGPIRWHDRRRARIGRRAQRRMGSARRTRPSETRRASAGRSNDVRGSLGEWAVKAATAVSLQHENVTLTGARRAGPRRPRPVQPGNINYLTGRDSENLFDTQACIVARDGDPSLVLFDFERGRFDNSTWSPSRSRTGHSTIRSPPSSTSSGDAVSIEDASASSSGGGLSPPAFPAAAGRASDGVGRGRVRPRRSRTPGQVR